MTATLHRIEQGYSLGWIDANPELFGKAIANLLAEYPPDKWNISIRQAYMPGEKYMILCTPKVPPTKEVPLTAEYLTKRGSDFA